MYRVRHIGKGGVDRHPRSGHAKPGGAPASGHGRTHRGGAGYNSVICRRLYISWGGKGRSFGGRRRARTARSGANDCPRHSHCRCRHSSTATNGEPPGTKEESKRHRSGKGGWGHVHHSGNASVGHGNQGAGGRWTSRASRAGGRHRKPGRSKAKEEVGVKKREKNKWGRRGGEGERAK